MKYDKEEMFKTSPSFMQEMYFHQKNQAIREEIEATTDDFDYNMKKTLLKERIEKGSLPLIYENGEFRECSFDTQAMGIDEYDNISSSYFKQNARNQFEYEMFEELERFENRPQLEVSRYSILNPDFLAMMKKEEDENSDDSTEGFCILDEDESDLKEFLISEGFYDRGITFDEEFDNPEKEMIVSHTQENSRKEIVVQNPYDLMVMYLYLYSSGEIQKEFIKIEDVLSCVIAYYDKQGYSVVLVEKVKIDQTIGSLVSDYLSGIFVGGSSRLYYLNMIPNALFFVSTSPDKYANIFELFDKHTYVFLRAPYFKPEIQGDFIEVASHKFFEIQGLFRSYVIEDTALSLGKLSYKGGPYIKDLYQMGDSLFVNNFEASDTLWTSVVVAADFLGRIFLSIYGTCGSIGKKSPVKKGYSFDKIHYVDGKNVAETVVDWEKYHPRIKAMKRLSSMMTHKDGGSLSDLRVLKGFCSDGKTVMNVYCSYGFYGSNEKSEKFFREVLRKHGVIE